MSRIASEEISDALLLYLHSDGVHVGRRSWLRDEHRDDLMRRALAASAVRPLGLDKTAERALIGLLADGVHLILDVVLGDAGRRGNLIGGGAHVTPLSGVM